MTVRAEAEAMAPTVQALLTKIWGQSFTLTDLIEVILQVGIDATHTPTTTL